MSKLSQLAGGLATALHGKCCMLPHHACLPATAAAASDKDGQLEAAQQGESHLPCATGVTSCQSARGSGGEMRPAASAAGSAPGSVTGQDEAQLRVEASIV